MSRRITPYSTATRLRQIEERPGLGRRIDLGAAQQIIEATDPVPPVAVPFDHQAVATILAGGDVIVAEQTD